MYFQVHREHTHKKTHAKAFKDVFLLNGFYSYCKGWGISYYCQQWELAIQPPALLQISNLTMNKSPFWQVYPDWVVQGKYSISICKTLSTVGSWAHLESLFFTVVQLKNRNVVPFSKEMHIRHLIAIKKFDEQGRKWKHNYTVNHN